MAELWAHVGITPLGIVAVAVSTTLLYGAYSVMLSVWGPRLFTSASVLSMALLAVLGGLFARSMLGDYPTMAGGFVAAMTLLSLEAALGRMRAALPAGARDLLYVHRPLVAMVEGRIVHHALTKRRLSEREFLALLRVAGVRDRSQAALVILESRGGLTVLAPGERIEPELVQDVVGAHEIPDHLLR
ncbi:MAG: YetF domain-containing protein [Actinomycetales bacterium]